MLGNAVGLIDNDFSDEVGAIVLNIKNSPITIPAGTKLCQLEFTEKVSVDIQENKVDTTDEHRGFGSTGQ